MKQFEFFTSKDNNYKLEIIGYDEPNNGRELWKVKIYNKSSDITDSICRNWNFINYITNRYQIDSINSEYIYIPIEGEPKLLRTKDGKVIELPGQSLSTVRFIGNAFELGYLIENYSDEIVLTDLETFKSIRIKISNVTWSAMIDKENLSIDYWEIQTGNNGGANRKRLRAIYNIKISKFI